MRRQSLLLLPICALLIACDGELTIDQERDAASATDDASVAMDAALDLSPTSGDAAMNSDGWVPIPLTNDPRCAPKTEQGQFFGALGSLSIPDAQVVRTTVSPAGTIFALTQTQLLKYDGMSWTTVTTQVGTVLPMTFETTLIAVDDDHVYWNPGSIVREWSGGTVKDHFDGNPATLHGFHVASPTELWAVGFQTLLHEEGDVVTPVDLAALLGAGVDLWSITAVGDDLAAIGHRGGAVGVLVRLHNDVLAAATFSTSPAMAFPYFATPTCGGNLMVGGDYGHVGFVTLEPKYTYVGGGNLDLITTDTVVTCGGISIVAAKVGSSGSFVYEVENDDPANYKFHDSVPGAMNGAFCHKGAVYYHDSEANKIRRYN